MSEDNGMLAMLSDPQLLQCPYPAFDMLRSSAPVVEIPGLGFAVTSNCDVMTILRNPALYSSQVTEGFAGSGLTLNQPRPESVEQVMAQGYPEERALLFTDGALHRRHRALVVQGFTPRRVAQLEVRIKAIAEELLGKFVHRGSVELVSEFSADLPLIVIAEATGTGTSDLPKLREWSYACGSPPGRYVPEDEFVKIAELYLEFQRYFAERIDERRTAPKDDLLTDLVNAELDGEDPLSKSELLNILSQLLTAGNETTADSIANAAFYLAEHPEMQDRLRADPTQIEPFIEEILRMESPVQSLLRVTTEDTELAGVPIPAGARVVVMYGAANRDPEAFACPAELDLVRGKARNHLAFSFGTHYCAGAALARAQLRIALTLLLDRLRDLRVADGHRPEYRPSIGLRGLTALRLSFTPEETGIHATAQEAGLKQVGAG